MKQKIYEMFEEKLVRINTAYNSLNSESLIWKRSLNHDIELCKSGLAYFKSGAPTPEEAELKKNLILKIFRKALEIIILNYKHMKIQIMRKIFS